MISSLLRKGQVSIEYLAIFSIALMITLPLIIIFIVQTQNLQADITTAEVNRISETIIVHAEQVYFMGEPAKRTITLTFPKGIDSITIHNHMLIINVTTAERSFSVVQETVANMTGTINSGDGVHHIQFEAAADQVHITG